MAVLSNRAWRRVLFPLLALFLLSAASHSQDNLYRVKRVVDGDTLLLTNGDRGRLIRVDTPEVHESKKLYRDAERTGRDIKTIRALGKKASAFTKSLHSAGNATHEIEIFSGGSGSGLLSRQPTAVTIPGETVLFVMRKFRLCGIRRC